jgi:hypothetical protein
MLSHIVNSRHCVDEGSVGLIVRRWEKEVSIQVMGIVAVVEVQEHITVHITMR